MVAIEAQMQTQQDWEDLSSEIQGPQENFDTMVQEDEGGVGVGGGAIRVGDKEAEREEEGEGEERRGGEDNVNDDANNANLFFEYSPRSRLSSRRSSEKDIPPPSQTTTITTTTSHAPGVDEATTMNEDELDERISSDIQEDIPSKNVPPHVSSSSLDQDQDQEKTIAWEEGQASTSMYATASTSMPMPTRTSWSPRLPSSSQVMIENTDDMREDVHMKAETEIEIETDSAHAQELRKRLSETGFERSPQISELVDAESVTGIPASMLLDVSEWGGGCRYRGRVGCKGVWWNYRLGNG